MTTYRRELVWWKPWTWVLLDAMTAVEPEFDAEQRDLLAALDAWERDLGTHGHPMSETTSPDADPNDRARKYHYEAGPADAPGLPVVDYAAKAIGDAQDAHYKSYPDESRNGHMWMVRKVSG